ncbi:MAG TPA: response regulator transcription factor [Actinomycetales bacterium]|nr:response regulator transcription factor [Actinomycetales bacterium]
MPEEVFSVLIVEDHLMVAAGLKAMLEDEPDLEVVGQAATVAAAVVAVADLRPDVVMLDFRLPDGQGADAITAVLGAFPEAKILTVTAHSEAEALGPAVSAGVMGFVRKDSPGDELLTAVRTVAAGGAYFSRDAMAQIIRGQRPDTSGPAVSEREVEVLQRLADGLTIPVIARELDLSQHTVRNHLRSVMAKLGVHTSLDAVVHGARAGLIDLRLPD